VEQIAVGGVDLDKVETGGVGALGGEAEGLNGGVDAAWSRSLGNGVSGREGDGAGATGCQPPSSGLNKRSPVKGTDMLALRPAWASWMPARMPWEWRN